MPHPGASRVFVGIVALLVAACAIAYRPRSQPEGVAVALYLAAGDSLYAEVLAVEDDALVVLVDAVPAHRLSAKLARIPFARIRDGRFEHVRGESTGASLASDPGDRDRVRLLSRYPQGLSDELLVPLEAAYGEVEVLAPGGR